MIRIDIPMNIEPEKIAEMKQWLLENCDNDQFYFYPYKAAVERPAIFKFESSEDAFAFRFMFDLLDLKVTEEE